LSDNARNEDMLPGNLGVASNHTRIATEKLVPCRLAQEQPRREWVGRPIPCIRRDRQIKQFEKIVACPANRKFCTSMSRNMDSLAYRLIEGNAGKQVPSARLP
jgi:hypothetical protein